MYPQVLPFVLIHAGCVAAIWSDVSWQALAICAALYWLRMFGITAGYHRYFSHRAYATSRVFQFILAFLAQSSAQKSVLWWAAKHRHHHLHSDTAHDVHSPRHKGFVYSHVGWIFYRQHDATDLVKVSDLASYPELMWLHRLELLPAAVLAGLCFLLAGWSGLVVGFLWSTVLLYHATFCINSLAHVHGRRRYVTGDDSRNNWLLALLTMGEGWHNNHHAYQASARQGFYWYEVDLTYYVLVALSWLGIVRDLKLPPRQVLRNEHRLGSRVVKQAAEQLAARFDPEHIALAIRTSIHETELSVRDALSLLQHRADLRLSSMPTREQLLAEAQRMFAKTISLDDIVDRAYELLHDSVGFLLATPALSASTNAKSGI
ncbi:delta 9 acyl-lipid fatty acid desaturase [Bradyrhizobium sp. CCBAU 11386]|uniref:acyl-CoA desaturase n=1 Tax=Bradyrhizobium sp. CCBAU 11386 TaxID=1630837 RepID=UPI002303FC70|nr:acyl-CoA desaturase [Bradyrhizobium sp. CCBAU 11386]MDA9507118.1 delta 9 acyl-lipid fatty acid desaturase [Bradyrhizobium sp. CCBAU 11386]